jgi:hypothetical protein
VDGAKVKSVDLYNSTSQWRKAIYVKNNMNLSRAHTLEVDVLGTKSATSGGTRVDVDAFVVLRSP